jgi:hypothetical protein
MKIYDVKQKKKKTRSDSDIRLALKTKLRVYIQMLFFKQQTSGANGEAREKNISFLCSFLDGTATNERVLKKSKVYSELEHVSKTIFEHIYAEFLSEKTNEGSQRRSEQMSVLFSLPKS